MNELYFTIAVTTVKKMTDGCGLSAKEIIDGLHKRGFGSQIGNEVFSYCLNELKIFKYAKIERVDEKLRPIPSNRRRYEWDSRRENEIHELRKQVATETHRTDDGALCWDSSNNPVPDDILAVCGVDQETRDANRAARDRFLDEYRERMKDHEYSDEEMFEMRAAYGPGTTVVNVITGKKITL